MWVWAILYSSRWLRKPLFRQRTSTSTAPAPAPIPSDFLLLCRFGPFSPPAVGSENLYYGNAPTTARHRHQDQFLAISCSCVGLGHSLLQPLAAEAFISATHRTQRNAPATAPAPSPAPIPSDFLFLCGFGPFSPPAVGCGNLYFGNAPAPAQQQHQHQFLAISCSCVGLGHSLLQPFAAGTFISATHRHRHGTGTSTDS